jgi:Zn-dependent protease
MLVATEYIRNYEQKRAKKSICFSISMALSFFNILPIYGLDGEHFLVAFVELMFIGRENKRMQQRIVTGVLRGSSGMMAGIFLYSFYADLLIYDSHVASNQDIAVTLYAIIATSTCGD